MIRFELTTAFWLGTEGTGHHLWHEIWKKLTVVDEQVAPPIYILRQPSPSRLLRDLNSTRTGSATIGVGIDSHPTGSWDSYPNFTNYVQRIEAFNREELSFGTHIEIRSVVMKRHLASTVASAIRRGFPNVHKRPLWDWRGMKLIEQQVRSATQDQWIMVDYEDFLRRPREYAPILAKWFQVDNVTSFEHGLQAVQVRDPKRDILQESWTRIREWDVKHSSNANTNGFTLERVVQDVMKLWEIDTESIWNNECVVVSPENPEFIEKGWRCF